MKKYMTRGFVVATMVALIVVVGNWTHKKYVHWRFSGYVINYSHKMERETAHTILEMADPVIDRYERSSYQKRLDQLEDKYQHPLREAIHNLTDPEFPRKDADCFDKLITDVRFRVRYDKGADTKLKEKVEELCQTQGKIACVAWPFILEDMNLHTENGVMGASIPYEKVLEHRDELQPLEERMSTLLAAK